MATSGGICPRCKGYSSFRVDRETLYQHKKPYGGRCPAGGLTWTQAREGWTSLSWRTYNWLKTHDPDEAEPYKERALK